MKKRRFGWQFYVGIVVGCLLAPLIGIVLVWIFGGTDPARRPAPPPPQQADITLQVSRDYLEQALDASVEFVNPVLQLGDHEQGGAALTLTVGFDFPIVGVQDVRTEAQLIAENGELVLITEEASLGQDNRLRVPGNLIENALSTIVNRELKQRLNSSDLNIYIVNVRGDAEALHIDAIIPSAGE